MATKHEKITSTKRFGARYGPRNKIKYDRIERMQRARQKCPYCTYTKVSRISTGIWSCKTCNAKFTGRAYTAQPTSIRISDVEQEEGVREDQ